MSLYALRKSNLFVAFLVFLSFTSFSQTDSLLQRLDGDAKQELLPARMLFTQRMLWGEKGLLRSDGLLPLNEEKRSKELKIRRKMLVAHQVLGFATLAGMAAQGIVGAKLYKQGGRDLRDLHEGLAVLVNTTYFTTAGLSLFAPPPMLNRDKGFTSIRAHKWLAAVHLTGMIATNILAGQLEHNPNLKPVHRAAALTTFAAFTAAMVVIKF